MKQPLPTPTLRDRVATAFVVATVAIVSVGTIASRVEAAEPGGQENAAGAAPESAQTTAVPTLLPSGMLVFVDPATGQILERPRPEQLAALYAQRITQAARVEAEEARQRQLDALPRYAVPGGWGVDVEGYFDSALVVERAPDGSLRFRCTDSQHDGHDHAVPVAPATGRVPAPPEL